MTITANTLPPIMAAGHLPIGLKSNHCIHRTIYPSPPDLYANAAGKSSGTPHQSAGSKSIRNITVERRIRTIDNLSPITMLQRIHVDIIDMPGIIPSVADHMLQYYLFNMKSAGRFRAAKRHSKQTANIIDITATRLHLLVNCQGKSPDKG